MDSHLYLVLVVNGDSWCDYNQNGADAEGKVVLSVVAVNGQQERVYESSAFGDGVFGASWVAHFSDGVFSESPTYDITIQAYDSYADGWSVANTVSDILYPDSTLELNLKNLLVIENNKITQQYTVTGEGSTFVYTWSPSTNPAEVV